jgi:fructose-bisphosphate aldolase class II
MMKVLRNGWEDDMFCNFVKMLQKAKMESYAVGSFNVYNYETMKGAVLAAADMKKPVIIAFGAKYLDNMSLKDVVAMARSLSDEHEVEMCLHLDHCSDMNLIFRAIQAGFSSVMYDGSTLPYEMNLYNTTLVSDVAASCGVSVEAELGSIAATDTSFEGNAVDIMSYTSPDAAGDFAYKSGCDALAVSIGTVHGLYKDEPNVRLDLLQAIRKRVSQPLVLHGGSGLPQEIIKKCIAGGICKINVNTEISFYTIEKTKKLFENGTPHLAVVAEKQQQYVKEVVSKYMKFFNRA